MIIITKNKDVLKIENLRNELNKADTNYFINDISIMTDFEYDKKMEELIKLEKSYPEEYNKNSPSQRVGGKTIDGFKSFSHCMPMLSINNTYSIADLKTWYEKIIDKFTEEDLSFYCDPKIDGIAVSLRYENGILCGALTRGDGIKGDDITEQVRKIKAIPLILNKKDKAPYILEIRGEIFIPISKFNLINKERKEDGENLLANARNAASGTLKSLNTSLVRKRYLNFLAHGLGESSKSFNSFQEFFDTIHSFGIPSSKKQVLCKSFEEISSIIEKFSTEKDLLDYEVDGMVIKVDSISHQSFLGSTNKAPRWCVAYKYPAKQIETILKRVVWQVGKGGALTPRATMTPVLLDGTVVSHATLHNIEEINKKDIRINDTVVIEKAGEIIPQVIKVIKSHRKVSKTIPIIEPSFCPCCKTKTVKKGPKIYCVNQKCSDQFREKVKWFVGRNQMNIDSMGDKIIDQIIDNSLIKDVADIFSLKKQDLINLDRMGEKSVKNILSSIEKSKNMGMGKVLKSLGISQIGTNGSKILSKHFKDIWDLQSSTKEELENLPDFGKITVDKLHEFLHSQEGVVLINKLEDANVNLNSLEYKKDKEKMSDSIFSNKTIVITGTLESFKREELKSLIEEKGGVVKGSISSKTDLLIAGEKAGSKLKKAQSLNIEIWDEEKLKENINE